MKKLAAVVAASLLTMSTASVAAQAAPSASALSLKSAAARATPGKAKKSKQAEGVSTALIVGGVVAAGALVYVAVDDGGDSN